MLAESPAGGHGGADFIRKRSDIGARKLLAPSPVQPQG
jgi:hypothetical protein